MIMIKKILDWILGKTDKEAPPATLSASEAERLNKEIAEILPPAPEPQPAPAVETAPVIVKTKYKADALEKMKKDELAALVKKHKLEVKARATKSEMIKALSKV